MTLCVYTYGPAGLTVDVEKVLKAHGRDNKLIIEFKDDDTLFKAS